MNWTLALLRGLIGIVFLLGLAWLMSSDRKRVNWRIVGSGLGLQFVLAVLVLKVAWVGAVFDLVSDGFVAMLNISKEASVFVFGALSDSEKTAGAFGENSGFIFATQALPSIIFFSAISSVLYYLGILQRIVMVLAWVMSRVMRLSGAESLAAAANVFIGQTEAPLVVKPYISKMTRSEIMALMVGGMATIAGSVFGIYIGFLSGGDDEVGRQFGKVLLCASVMNAPAALLIAKILLPETEKVNMDLRVEKESVGRNVIDALANGTSQGLKLALNVAAMIIAFYACILLANSLLGDLLGQVNWFGAGTLNEWVNWVSGEKFNSLSLQAIFGFLFAPIAWAIGITGGDVLQVGQLLGTKIFATEFFAFLELGQLKAAGELSPRSVFISTFALCGFANFMSIGIQIGGIGGLAPEQRSTLASLGVKAMIGGMLASCLSASIAGILF
ncbi:MAG: CNT family concentrative nucleoside transporter [Pseudoalteromonas tetraodonis]|jgi:CNT family concentrative nucleoside transporter